MVGGMILSWLNFSVNFSLVGIKCLRFLIMTFPFSFRTLYNRGQLFYFMTMPFLSQIIFSSVRILMIFPCEIFGKEWVVLWDLGVTVTNEFSGSKGWTEGRFVRSWLLNNFWTGEIPFLLGYEFKNNKARYLSCWSYVAIFKVHLRVWIDLSAKPLDWW